MKHRRIGGLEVSVIGLGCNNFGRRLTAAATADVVHAALDAGVNFFDTATIYGGEGRSEEYLGLALRGHRDRAVIASKFGHSVEGVAHPGSAAYVRTALDASLRRLGVDCIDLYQLHQPDSSIPVGETLGALTEAVAAGKVREIGCSNFSAAQLREAQAAAPSGAHFASVQNEYSLFHREPETEILAECERLGVAFLPYFPLANGLLTGKYRAGQPAPPGSRLAEARKSNLLSDENIQRVERLIDFATQRGHSLLELATSWLLAQRVVASVIAGATTSAQVTANAASGDWTLTDRDLRDVDRIVSDPAAGGAGRVRSPQQSG